MVRLPRFGLAALALVLVLPAPASAEPSPAPPAVVVRAPQVVAENAPKVAVVGSDTDLVGTGFTVVDGSDTPVLEGTLEAVPGDPAPWAHAAGADFSDVDAGSYRVVVAGIESGPVHVREDPYSAVLTSLLGIFDANADGREKSSLHRPSHLHDARSRIRNGSAKGRVIDVAGGWMDAGDQLKFTVTIGYATTLLQLAARSQPSRARRLHAVANVGVRWLLKAHPSDRVFVAQVGDTDADHSRGFRDPTKDDSSKNPLLSRRPSEVLTRSSRGADVAASAATALALAAQRASGHRKARLVRAAKEWFLKARRLRGPWRNCCYSQDTVRDDLAGAAVELWRATGQPAYRKAALGWLTDVTGNGRRGWRVAMDGYEMAGLPAAELCGVLGARAPENDRVRNRACRILRTGGGDTMFNARVTRSAARARSAGAASGRTRTAAWSRCSPAAPGCPVPAPRRCARSAGSSAPTRGACDSRQGTASCTPTTGRSARGRTCPMARSSAGRLPGGRRRELPGPADHPRPLRHRPGGLPRRRRRLRHQRGRDQLQRGLGAADGAALTLLSLPEFAAAGWWE